MKLNEAASILAKNKKGHISPKNAPKVILNGAHLNDEWVYNNIIEVAVNDINRRQRRTTIERSFCPDMPPIMFTLVEAL